MMNKHLVVLVLVAWGCSAEPDGTDAEGAVCEDPKYGDGTCDLDTTCDVVDVDCLVTFETPEAAKSWYDSQSLAAIKGPSLPVSDPRFAPTQALLDEGWATYRSIYDVGDLADQTVQLVLVDSKEVNAFVLSDSDRVRAGLAVMVNTALVDRNAPKAQMLGIVMHELQHAIAVHVNNEVKARMRTYYLAPNGMEPLGNAQTDNPAVRATFEAWQKYANLVGWASDAELSGLPFMAMPSETLTNGFLGPYFFSLIAERVAANPTTACKSAYNAFIALHERLRLMVRPIDASFAIAPTESPGILAAATKLRDDCFAGVAGDAVLHLARLMKTSEAKIRGELPPELLAGIEGKSVVAGWFNAIVAGRQKMRELEASLASQTGSSWSRLRYFSIEEDADDVSARIMKAMGLAPDGSSQLLIAIEPGLAPACTPLLNSNTEIPYGEMLTDDHHGTCWRARHQQAIAATTSARLLPTWRPLGPAREEQGFMRLVGGDEIDATGPAR